MAENKESGRMTIEDMRLLVESTDTVPYTLYQSNKMKKGCLFCFVEGKHDTDYYQPKVKSIYGDNYFFIPCNNKKNVLSVYDQIYSSDHERFKIAFFIDKDFDPSISKPCIYETECYSIENYYVYPCAFSEFLQYCLHLKKDSAEYTKAVNYYKEEFRKFNAASLLLNSWIAVCREKDNRNEMIHIDSLSDSYPSSFLSINFGAEYQQLYDLALMNSYFHVSPYITQEELDAKVLELQGKDYFSVFRGKYELHFYYHMLQDLKTKVNHRHRGQELVLEKLSWDLNYPNLMIYYSNYAYFPDTLRQFILGYC